MLLRRERRLESVPTPPNGAQHAGGNASWFPDGMWMHPRNKHTNIVTHSGTYVASSYDVRRCLAAKRPCEIRILVIHYKPFFFVQQDLLLHIRLYNRRYSSTRVTKNEARIPHIR